MDLGVRCVPSGVPTTPRPRHPAPNPRYNDLTRPRSLQIDADARQEQQTNVSGRNHVSGSTSGGELGRQHIPQPARQQQQQQQQQWQPWSGSNAEEVNATLCRSASGSNTSSEAVFEQQRQSPFPPDPEFPLPWQGNIDLPEGDEETMNAAQTWIEQILHENFEDMSDDDVFLSNGGLTDGRVLCRVANSIAPGSVKRIHEDRSNNDSNMCSFLIACRTFGVPAGALFDVNDPDPRRVGLCLHVLSRVVRDTVPQFRGPYLLVRPSSSRSWSQTAAADRDSSSGNTSTHRNNLPSSEGVGSAGPEASRQWPVAVSDEDRLYQHDPYQQHQRRPRPPTPPPEERPRPLSFPSRFSPAASAGGTVWSSQFPSSASLDGVGGVAGTPAGARTHGGIGGVGGIGDIGGRGGGEGGGGEGGEAAAASMWHTTTGTEATPLGKDGPFEHVSPSPESLSIWLSNLNLGTFERALVNIGVESIGDLRYVQEQDLSEIGMHGPQIRKLLQNRP
ncbi:unnamed protein product [Ectocarpus sp. 6 AP-2014]